MNNPKISIIVPVYGVEQFLPKCLESILAQTYKNIEVICINDESPDSSLNILEEYKDEDDRVIIINKKNEGVSAARNTGLAAATGDYIMFVDGDDWVDEDMCMEMLSQMQKNSADVCMCCYCKEFENTSFAVNVFDADKIFEGEAFAENIYRKLMGPYKDELRHPEGVDSCSVVWMNLFKKETVEGIKFIDLKLLGTAEDLMFRLYTCPNIGKFVYINKPFYHYRKTNTGSITNLHKPRLYEQREYMFGLMEDIIRDNNLPEDYRVALRNRVALNVIGLGLNEIYSNKSFLSKAKVIKKILKAPRYKEAFKNLEYKYFPVHWWVFFKLCKMKLAIPLVLLLQIMEFLRKRGAQ